ncbi:hypothetical protein JMUB5056_2066 [Leptotrichia hongkongensis]|uniref:Uncharacterized protein n=1 Tax=Leptotrichia hongkongensis TaxID=554406 RepID=A0A510LCS5_9FUSO|nr:hypothetical protein JMUB5056_2066 [Leptotrichia hongkongensis]
MYYNRKFINISNLMCLKNYFFKNRFYIHIFSIVSMLYLKILQIKRRKIMNNKFIYF